MKKSFLTIAVLAFCSMMNAQTTLKVKTIKEEVSLPQSYISCTIKVDYPVSSSNTLNSRIMKFLLQEMDVNTSSGWTFNAEVEKPKIHVNGMTSFRKYMKAYTKNIVGYAKSEDLDNCGCDLYLKFLGQGTKFVCYNLNVSEVSLDGPRNYITNCYYIVSKATGKPVKNLFMDNTEEKLYALAKKHLKNDEERKSLDEEKDKCVVDYWMEDSKYVHFIYSTTSYDVATGKIPINEAKQYLTKEMKALIK